DLWPRIRPGALKRCRKHAGQHPEARRSACAGSGSRRRLAHPTARRRTTSLVAWLYGCDAVVRNDVLENTRQTESTKRQGFAGRVVALIDLPKLRRRILQAQDVVRSLVAGHRPLEPDILKARPLQEPPIAPVAVVDDAVGSAFQGPQERAGDGNRKDWGEAQPGMVPPPQPVLPSKAVLRVDEQMTAGAENAAELRQALMVGFGRAIIGKAHRQVLQNTDQDD